MKTKQNCLTTHLSITQNDFEMHVIKARILWANICWFREELNAKALGLHIREKAENVSLFVDLFIVYNKNKQIETKIKKKKVMDNRIIQSDC